MKSFSFLSSKKRAYLLGFCSLLLILSCNLEQDSTAENFMVMLDPENKAIDPIGTETFKATGRLDEGFKRGAWSYETPKKDLTIFWRIANANNFKVNIPMSWNIIPQKDGSLVLRTNYDDEPIIIQLKEAHQIGDPWLNYEMKKEAYRVQLINSEGNFTLSGYQVHMTKNPLYLLDQKFPETKEFIRRALFRGKNRVNYELSLSKVGKLNLQDKIIFARILFSLEKKGVRLISTKNSLSEFETLEIEDITQERQSLNEHRRKLREQKTGS